MPLKDLTSGAAGLAGQAAGKATSAASGGVQRAQGLATGLAGHASAARGTLATASSSHLKRAQEIYKTGDYARLPTQLHELVREKADVGALKEAGFGAAGAALAERKKRAHLALFELSAGPRARMLFAIRELVKSQVVADPDMWKWVKGGFEGSMDLFWDDLTIYIESCVDGAREAAAGQAEDVEGLAALGDSPTVFSPWWCRAKFLYHLQPFDRSIFGQARDPVFWALTCISLIPYYGIRIIFFTIVLVCNLGGCPPDEYQLVQYILAFKGTQFLSSGLAMAVVAAVKYWLCVHPGGRHTCDSDGPGANQDLLMGSVDFLGSCILVWVAFLVLPCSQRSAGNREIVESGKVVTDMEDGAMGPRNCCCCRREHGRGGRLGNLLAYDLLAFALSCAFLFMLAYVDQTHLRPGGEETVLEDPGEALTGEVGTWQFRTAVFWARVFYAFLAFPFTIFKLPLLSGILTHTTATGYNRQGLCVPYLLHPVLEEGRSGSAA